MGLNPTRVACESIEDAVLYTRWCRAKLNQFYIIIFSPNKNMGLPMMQTKTIPIKKTHGKVNRKSANQILVSKIEPRSANYPSRFVDR